ncbi:MAG: thiamine-phosphate kinase [Parvularculales bacterium]
MQNPDLNDLDEFSLIKSLFEPLTRGGAGAFGLQDDGAVFNVPAGLEVGMSKDILTAGVHFHDRDAPDIIARKALRVNLSDLAAMGAHPYGYLLGLAWPRDRPRGEIENLAKGLAHDGAHYDISLLGGDTIATKGPLTLSVTVCGFVPQGTCLRRAGAAAGDGIYVSGTVGDAAAGLGVLQGRVSCSSPRHEAYLTERYHLPEPRQALGVALRGVATAAVDVSDGLVADLGHLCEASGVGATIELRHLPLSGALISAQPTATDDQQADAYSLVLGGGDDYELLFTAPAEAGEVVAEVATGTDTSVTRIGVIEAGSGVRVVDASGGPLSLPGTGYRHF